MSIYGNKYCTIFLKFFLYFSNWTIFMPKMQFRVIWKVIWVLAWFLFFKFNLHNQSFQPAVSFVLSQWTLDTAHKHWLITFELMKFFCWNWKHETSDLLCRCLMSLVQVLSIVVLFSLIIWSWVEQTILISTLLTFATQGDVFVLI